MSIIKYHPHIDGLRAIAVCSVIIFHLNNAWLPGGFVGVDIFFVISGFLITSILYKQIETGGVDFKIFYTRRIKRILPLFNIVVLTSVLVAFLILLPKDFSLMMRSVRATFLFISNFHFSKGGDYFSPESETMPLLHTWSLAVEEQFYLIWPLLLVFILRKLGFTKKMLVCLLAVISISFVLSTLQVLVGYDQTKAFYYLFPARFSELLMGAFLALLINFNPRIITIPSPFFHNLLGIIGLFCLFYAFFFINSNSLFPGYNALIPCLGAALIIYSGLSLDNKSLLSMLLESRFMLFLGVLSYSLYLWHWPVMAFTRYFTMEVELGFREIVFCIATTFVLSILSWKYIESPLRKVNWSFKRSLLIFYIIPFSLVIILATAIDKLHGGKTWQVNDSDLFTRSFILNENSTCNKSGAYIACDLGDNLSNNNILFFGDSHAEHLIHYADIIGIEKKANVKLITAQQCSSIPNYSTDGMFKKRKQKEACARLASKVDNYLPKASVVVIALRWSIYLGESNRHSLLKVNPGFKKNLNIFIDNLVSSGKTVVLMSQIPEYKFDVLRNSINKSSRYNPISDDGGLSNQFLKDVAKKSDNIIFNDTNSVAMTWINGNNNGKPMYSDWNHLNIYGASELALNSLDSKTFNFLDE